MLKQKKRVSYPALIALGFFIMIVAGTLLLMLPAASKSGEPAPFLNAMFTATSASCVTGLVVYDTFTRWSGFGQAVLLALIQTGGLGFMTIITMFSLFLRRRIGLTERTLMRESINTMYIGGIVRLTKRILTGTVLFEGAGALLLSLRFVPLLGFRQGLWYSVFHAVSAFCNAGFDLFGRFGEYGSLSLFAEDGLVNGTIMALILIGGIGFFVWEDLCENKLHFRRYSLHTKLVLVTSAALVVVPAAVFYFVERDGTLAALSPSGRVWASLFCAVTPRTAGFNTVDTAALSPAGSLLTVMLMFVGGCPGSTAGGVKTTTIAVILVSVLALLRNETVDNVFGRRLEENAFKHACAVFGINLSLALGAALLIEAAQPALAPGDVMFECFSAIGTVGMSTGVTRALGSFSRAVIALLMYLGRVGSLSFALIFTGHGEAPVARYPVERVNIG